MKTIKQLLKQLPLQKRLQVIENIRKHSCIPLQIRLKMYAPDLKTGILKSFVFSNTRQGKDYWIRIINT